MPPVFALRRSTAAFSILGAPLAFASGVSGVSAGARERRKERALGVLVRREADPRTPGTTIATSWARAPIPIHIQFRLQDAPKANGDSFLYMARVKLCQ